MDFPIGNISTTRDIRISRGRGPWVTKSGGQLWVLSALTGDEVKELLRYEMGELARVPLDIRGLRHYVVRDLPAGAVGGTEFHRIRREWVFTARGEVLWRFEDLYGGVHEVVVSQGHGVFIPPYLLHTYTVAQEGTELLAVANTLFVPDDPRTHDTYSMDDFQGLRTELARGKP